MAGLFDTLAAAAGAPIDRADTYGREMLRSAQTEGALENAKKTRAERIIADQTKSAREAMQGTLAASLGQMGYGETAQPLGDLVSNQILAGGGNFQSVMSGFDTAEGVRRARTIENPDSTWEQMQRANLAEGRAPINPIQNVGSEYTYNLLTGGMDPELRETGLGSARIESEQAQARLRDRSPGVGARTGTTTAGRLNSAGELAPTGFRWTDADDTLLEPITGGPRDPNAPVTAGSRETIFLNRMINSGNQAVATLRTMLAMPVGASSGVIGIGGSPGSSIYEATRDVLRNKVSDESTQMYEVAVSGLQRAMAMLEGSGLASSGQFTSTFDVLKLREGDTEATRLQKLAEVRQTVEAALEPQLASPRVPPEMKQYIRQIVDSARQLVPYTPEDAVMLTVMQREDPTYTLRDLIEEKNSGGLGSGGSSVPQAVPGAAPPPAAAAPPPGAPTEGATGVSKSGKPIVFRAGKWVYQ